MQLHTHIRICVCVIISWLANMQRHALHERKFADEEMHKCAYRKCKKWKKKKMQKYGNDAHIFQYTRNIINVFVRVPIHFRLNAHNRHVNWTCRVRVCDKNHDMKAASDRCHSLKATQQHISTFSALHYYVCIARECKWMWITCKCGQRRQRNS